MNWAKFTGGAALVAVSLAVSTFVVQPLALQAQEAEPDPDPDVEVEVEIASVTCDDVLATEPVVDVTFDSYEPQLAERIIDTRSGTGGFDGPVGAGCTLIIDTSESAPEDAVGLALSVTVVTPDAGFFTAFPCAQGLPETSSVNARPGLPTANLVLVAPDAAGDVCIFSEAGGHLIVDVSGWWTAGTTPFTAIDPVRAYDTRVLANPVKLPAAAIRDVDIAGAVAPDDAVAVAVNLAVVNPTDNGFFVVYPCGVEPPLASNLNFVAGEKRAVSAIVEVGEFGKICVTGNAETHFIVDVTGYYAPSHDFGPSVDLVPLDGERVVDTRFTNVAGTRFAGNDVQRFSLDGVLARPDQAVGVALNVVAVQAETGGFLTIDPCGDPRPTTSSLNYDQGQTANLVVTALTVGAEFCVYASTAVDVVIDVVGSFDATDESLANNLVILNATQIVAIDQEYVAEGADYTMRCNDGGLAGSVRFGTAPGVTAFVDGVAVDGAETDVAVPADGLLTVELERGSESARHYFRCVPPDFPFLTVTKSGENAPGWYLTGLGWTDITRGQFLAVLDERGVPVWFKRTERKLIDLKLLSTGNFVASPITGRGFGIDVTAGHRTFDLDGDLLDVKLPFDEELPSDHHDYVELGSDEGHAILSYPLLTNQDLTGVPVVDPRCTYDPTEANDLTIVDGTIEETDVQDQPWRWNASDHFSLDEVTYAQCFGNYPDEPGGSEVDVFHFNSMQRVDEAGCEPLCDYVISARHLDAVFRVDRATDAVEWILSSQISDPADPSYIPNLGGAPRIAIIDDPLGGPRRMHDALLDGNVLTMHDNRTGTGEPSRFVTYELDLSDPLAPTATLVRQIDHPEGATSGQVGSARLAADGSVLVNWGATQPMFVEYGADDAELLRIEMISGDQAYRIVKYGLDTFDVTDLRATAGGSVEAP